MSVYARFDVTCLAVPLQIEGTWQLASGPRTFYFRARHGRWTLHSPSPDRWEDWTTSIVASGDGDEFTIGEAVDLIWRGMVARFGG